MAGFLWLCLCLYTHRFSNRVSHFVCSIREKGRKEKEIDNWILNWIGECISFDLALLRNESTATTTITTTTTKWGESLRRVNLVWDECDFVRPGIAYQHIVFNRVKMRPANSGDESFIRLFIQRLLRKKVLFNNLAASGRREAGCGHDVDLCSHVEWRTYLKKEKTEWKRNRCRHKKR